MPNPLRSRLFASLLPCVVIVGLSAPASAVAARTVEGPDAAVIRSLIEAGNDLAVAYDAGTGLCARIRTDKAHLADIRDKGGVSMKRLLGVVERAQEPSVHEAFDHALRSVRKVEHTLDGAEEICRRGDDRLQATGYVYKMQDDAQLLVESGLRLCRTLQDALPRFTWPDCTRP
ncbi:hypothetical protein [Nitratidesulfovibrio vulgaris]|jgi:hypothetical protein|uniref:hypothetical protein n=1 Tax=Nitratidesulfovibrio vulgaris TaxID=881 RepID=UPI0023014F99|nr:hypothetical protein [Nitratidesulfovibrio vulgaris]WCB47316.1 hypothetical protein PH214_04340 [Nitratidesulfovibrio vulgaris]